MVVSCDWSGLSGSEARSTSNHSLDRTPNPLLIFNSPESSQEPAGSARSLWDRRNAMDFSSSPSYPHNRKAQAKVQARMPLIFVSLRPDYLPYFTPKSLNKMLFRRSLKPSSAASQLKSKSTGDAVLVLTEPYPVPNFVQVTVEKPKSGRLGIHFSWTGRKADRVQVSKINEDSPLQDTPLKVGHSVLSVNSVFAGNAVRASELILNGPKQVSITATCDPCSVKAPYCKLVSAPTSAQQHPGIRFSASRDRCLVQVSRLFPRGPFTRSGVSQGDIVLAVNGIPVSTPEEADQALREGLDPDTPYTVLYVVNMQEYRQSIQQEIQVSPTYHDILLEKVEKRGRGICLKVGEQVLAQLELDFDSQHLVDRKAHLQVASLPKNSPPGAIRRYNKVYRDVVAPFLKDFNEGMEKRMVVLEEAVARAAWEHSVLNHPAARSTKKSTISSSSSSSSTNENPASPEQLKKSVDRILPHWTSKSYLSLRRRLRPQISGKKLQSSLWVFCSRWLDKSKFLLCGAAINIQVLESIYNIVAPFEY